MEAPHPDLRFKVILDHLKSEYSLEELKELTCKLLSWGDTQTKYYDESAIFEILSDIVLRNEEVFVEVFLKDMKDMPLLINKEEFTVRTVAIWRLEHGH